MAIGLIKKQVQKDISTLVEGGNEKRGGARLFLISAASIAFLLSGCISAPKNRSHKLELEPPIVWKSAEIQGEFMPQDWANDFDDPMLLAIIEEALVHNYNLQAAEARLASSIAGSRFASSNLFPTINGTINKNRNKRSSASGISQTPTSETFGTNVRFQWELDVWGEVRNGYRGDMADIQAARATYEATRLSIAGRVAQSWYNTVEASLQYDLAVRTQEALESSAVIVEENFKRGIARALDVRLVRANVASNKSTVETRLRNRNAAVRNLEVLLGRYPSNELMAIGRVQTKEEVEAYNTRIDEDIAKLEGELATRQMEIVSKLRKAELSKVPEEMREDFRSALSTPEGQRTEIQEYLLDRFDAIAESDLELAEKSDKKFRAYRAEVLQQIARKNASKRAVPNGEVVTKLPEISGTVPAGLPSELLLRRPDVVAAERTLAASEQRKFETSKARLPSINITLSRGTNVRDVEDIWDVIDRRVWTQNFVGSQTLFQGGRLRANFRRAKANFERSIADYGNVVLNAFREVENALNNQSSYERDYEAQKLAAEESAAAEALAWEEYGRGLSTITTALDAVRRNITAQRSFIQVSNQRVQSRIDLYLALGGGFDVESES